ncbi:hypothetical protein ACGFRG_08705 [Streptomyces sp. NPDC048696]|uniref:hypothetical protein n=1 Tax=Streptomyces sp. NPDC048696 TaxID=3365585 RepID=UPI003711D237
MTSAFTARSDTPEPFGGLVVTDQNTTTSVLSELRRLAAAYRSEIERDWEAQRQARERNQCRGAVDFAIEYMQQAFPQTLDRALPAEAWQGYPVVEDGRPELLRPMAVTYLGEGLFVHCVREPLDADEWQGVLTLLSPCLCGCGAYREVYVGDDYALAWELDHAPGQQAVCGVTCISDVRFEEW